jgi:hypothetical protein
MARSNPSILLAGMQRRGISRRFSTATEKIKPTFHKPPLRSGELAFAANVGPRHVPDRSALAKSGRCGWGPAAVRQGSVPGRAYELFRVTIDGGHFLAVGILDPRKPGERSQPRPDARNHQVRTGDSHVPEGLHALPHELFLFGPHGLELARSRRTVGRSSGFQPAVSPTSSRRRVGGIGGAGVRRRRRIGNLRYSRLEICATGLALPRSEENAGG